MIMLLAVLTTTAQNIRYVKMSGNGGAYANDGLSWATPKSNIQDAINDLVDNGLKGEVWVAAGTYKPTESTESSGGSTLYMSFKIPAGITVRGGFATNPSEWTSGTKEDYLSTARPMDANGKFFTNQTILSGNLTSTSAEFTWDATKQRYTPQFYGNSYHVVWFALNGFDANGRAIGNNPKNGAAILEGCVIEGGHAYNNDINAKHPHNAYGGGVYMVRGSYLQNCVVRKCDASRDGGGIYMDGGGVARHCDIHQCQALGTGIDFGYGGGVCAEGSETAISNSVVEAYRTDKNFYNLAILTQSNVVNCVGRMGGGMAFKSHHTNQKYLIVSNATLVSNNTATTEAGGIYFLHGGGATGMTVVRNKCNGSGVTIGGVTTGRAGGVYCRDNAQMGNCVVWGNECANNHDAQYATSRSSNSNDLKAKFRYCAVSQIDYTDWSGTIRQGVQSLNYYNTKDDADADAKGIGDKNNNYPLFQIPYTVAGVTGVTDGSASYTEYIANNWETYSESALHHAGIQSVDLDHENETPAPEESRDYNNQLFNSRPTLGAFVSPDLRLAPEIDGLNANFYVDPEYHYGAHVAGNKGNSWTTPTRFLANVFEYIEADHASTGAHSLAGKTINVYVKEGTCDNTDSYRSGRVRMMSLNIPSDVNIYGSFPADLTGTDHELSKRNPSQTPTIITANIIDGEYEYNVAHLITIDHQQNILMDGFKLYFANATSTLVSNENKNGAAITITGSTTGIKFKNILVANCQADKGAVIYADASTASFENCIFHNNSCTVRNVIKSTDDTGLIYSKGGSHLTFDHCNVMRSVGFASYIDGTSSNIWTNSMFYGNLDRAQDNTNNCDSYSILAFTGAGAVPATLTGNHNMFDRKSYAEYNAGSFNLGEGIPATSSYHQVNNYSSGVSEAVKGQDIRYGLNYVYKSGLANGYPRMINPTKNAGVSKDGDITYYGRATSFEPHNDNPVVNAAGYSGAHQGWGKDFTTQITRDWGGLPDIGAVESHTATIADEGENANSDGQRAYGDVVYVRDYGTANGTKNTVLSTAKQEELDGSSWERAIDGNMLYTNYTLEQTPVYDPANEKKVTKEVDVFDGWKISINYNNTTYYLRLNGTTLSTTTNEEDATHWTVASSAGGTCLTSGLAGNNSARYIYTKVNETYYYIYVNTGSVSISTSTARVARIYANGSSGYFIRYNNNTARYLRYTGSLGVATSNSNNTWQFTEGTKKEMQTVTDYGEPIRYDEVRHYGSTNLNGLQFAVNLQNGRYTGDLHKEVWVGAGTYAKDPETGDKTCFIIKDGVDVYGAFPKTGNPAMDQRQALVSQYVKVVASYSADDYETIIQPITTTIQSTTARRVLGQPYDNNPFKGGYTKYDGALWDGFTVRYGVISNANITVPDRTGGGAGNGGGGVVAYDNITLRNLVVTNNTILRTTNKDCLGGGIYINGASVEQCYVINNLNQGWSGSAAQQTGECYGGGMTIENGTVFNSVIASNRCYAEHADGAGIFLYNANFFNNTIVNNKAEGIASGSTGRMSGGIAVWTNQNDKQNVLNVYNTISINNTGHRGSPYSDQANCGDENIAVQAGGYINLHNCVTRLARNSKGSSTRGNDLAQITYYPENLEVVNAETLFENVGAFGNFAESNLRLKKTAMAAINQGENEPEIADETYNLAEYTDMDYKERILDCTIDIGAYEYNDHYAIAADEVTVPGKAIYYVTPEGGGVASADSPENAACAKKLQAVLDAAGRYKYEHPTTPVIVKVANSYSMAHAAPASDFKYFADRTTDPLSTDTRLWSIIIPYGVEVWGGYTDATSTRNNKNVTNNAGENGFYRAATEEDVAAGLAEHVGDRVDARDITGNPTYLASYFYNREMKINAVSYHVATFSDRVYDGEGKPYLAGDASLVASKQPSRYTGNERNESDFLHMSEVINSANGIANINHHRAVLDGIFIEGGNANALSNSTSQLNINGYGGAAIVTDYAHVRNCIITGNTANYGGALALTDHALVSGTLMMENHANQNGGALYVFETGSTLSDGTVVNTEAPHGEIMDYNMAHVFTSTITNNTARNQGGGVWYCSELSPNVRFNSCAIWQNEANDQANVSGDINPKKGTTDQISALEFYPFAYSAIENVRASGTNNLVLETLNKSGVRFVKADRDGIDQNTLAVEGNTEATRYDDFGYYGLTDYSVLTHNGMPVSDYDLLKTKMAVADADFRGLNRTGTNNTVPRSYIEIGARSLFKEIHRDQLMLRLFVAKAENTNMDVVNTLVALPKTGDPGYNADKAYYAQEGSSFAFPFQSLQDALDYIHLYRTDKELLDQYHANNLPFEIFIAKGTYHPKRDVNFGSDHALAATFTIPEGVSLYGGFDAQGGKINETKNSYYGKYNEPNTSGKMASNIVDGDDIESTVHPISGLDSNGRKEFDINENLQIQNWPTADILARRRVTDLNANDIIEPWEFANQTILDGNTENTDNNGVYHVITIVADQNIAGMLPKASTSHAELEANHGAYTDDASKDYEEGQTIHINGLQVTGGYAYHYVEEALDEYSKYTFYQGGGILVDGNRYCDDYNKTDGAYDWEHEHASTFKHQKIYGVGYRDIPLSISNCKFYNNEAGYGGAIASNGTVDIFSSTFERNLARARSEKVIFNSENLNVAYPGQGGAIHFTHQLSAFNTVFANNEAQADGTEEIVSGLGGYQWEPQYHPSIRVQDPQSSNGLAVPRGVGGAIQGGTFSHFHLTNCNLVRNKANMYPAVQTMNPNYQLNQYSHPGGGAPGFPVVIAADYNQIVNSVAWGNEINENMQGSDEQKFAAGLICNYGIPNRGPQSGKSEITPYNPSFISPAVQPRNQADLDANFEETVWFSAYEKGKGITQNNKIDMRDLDYKPYLYGKFQVTNYDFSQPDANLSGGKLPPGFSTTPVNEYQNCNVTIDSNNNTLEGPNFVNPSHSAGLSGYMESADWSPARLNILVDQGSGRLTQNITLNNSKYECTFVKYGDAKVGESGTWAVPTDRTTGNFGYSVESNGDYVNNGAYTMTHYVASYPEYKEHLTLGNPENPVDYQFHKGTYMLDASGKPLLRISYDPNPTHFQTYIDMGVYEYQHIQLNPDVQGNAVDVLWVSTQEKPENGAADGHDWKNPTSDMQRAIETLLASRNDHKKEIRVMDGTYTPTYTMNGKQAFYIDTKVLNGSVILPLAGETPVYGEGVKSLTIKGGYSKDLFNQYDVEAYPAIFKGQESTDKTSNRWDYLFYIKDATSRYAINGEYNESNAFGAKKNVGDPILLMPIELEGLTFINDQANTTGIEGAAIYYDPHEDATGVAAVNMTEITYYTTEAKTVVSAVPTQYFTVDEEKVVSNTSPAQLTLSKCKIIGSGKKGDTTSSAVAIKSAVGENLIYNNVFHSNFGKPLVTAGVSKTINNTFAVNGNFVDLANGSTMFNSVLWNNNGLTGSYYDQVHIAGKKPGSADDTNTFAITGSSSFFARNAYTGGNTTETNYAVGQTIANNNYNVGLAADNRDLIKGPNFVDPDNSDVMARDFNLSPSLRLLNKGDNSYYNVNQTSGYTVYDLARIPTTGNDAANRQRVQAADIDLGAYEYQYDLNQVLYVDPNKTVSGTGLSWENALGYGNLQGAIDLVGIYHVNNPGNEGYVFVKGASGTNAGLNLNEVITLRDGVSIYGSIAAQENLTHESNNPATSAQFADIPTYADYVRYSREGVAASTANRTVVKGIRTSSATGFNTDNPDIVSLIDGFVVTNPDAVTSPVLDIKPSQDGAKVAARNIIIAGNNVTGNVAEVSNALLYEALIYGNQTTGSALHVGATGYVVSSTVEGATRGTTYNETKNSVTDNVKNSLINWTAGDATEKSFSYNNYRLSDSNLNYQLEEGSVNIDACEITNPLTADAAHLAHFVNYETDRDLLGNPRWLKNVSNETSGKIDRGAFETWRVDKDFVCGEQGTNSGLSDPSIKKHFYPHDGSVVYIMKGKSLVIDPFDPAHEVEPTPHNPGFMLLQEGASCYGNGRPMTCAFLAVERSLKAEGNVVSLPFAMNYSTNSAVPVYDTNGVLTLNKDAVNANVSIYNSSARADWKHNFHDASLDCWSSCTTTVPANDAVLVKPASGLPVVRFTAQGTSMTDYIYTETTDPYKTVTLTQYNDGGRDTHGNGNTDNNPDFTGNEDMGWNAIGLPYLVSDYKPYGNATTAAHGEANNGKYMMNIPHTLWMYYNGTTYSDESTNVNGDGGFYSVSSWKASDWNIPSDETARIWVGEGFFTQTSTLSDTETLTFYRPVYTPSASPVKTERWYMTDEIRPIDLDNEGAYIIGTRYYTPDGVQYSKPRKGVTIAVDLYSDGTQKTRKYLKK